MPNKLMMTEVMGMKPQQIMTIQIRMLIIQLRMKRTLQIMKDPWRLATKL